MRTRYQLQLRSNVKSLYDVMSPRISCGNRALAYTLNALNLPEEIEPPKGYESKEDEKKRIAENKETKKRIKAFLESLQAQGVPGANPNEAKEGEKKSSGQKQTKFFDAMLKDYRGIVKFIAENHSKVKKGLNQIIKDSGSIGIITDEVEMMMIKTYLSLVEAEDEAEKAVQTLLNGYPLYEEFLKRVRGCGTKMSGVLIGELDIFKAIYPSDFWCYCGLGVNKVPLREKSTGDKLGKKILDENGEPVWVWEGQCRKKDHRVIRKFINKKGEEDEKESINFNPFLKTKMIGVLAPSLIQQGGYYSHVYEGYKNRLNELPAHDKKAPAHKEAMAKRYMIKMFLLDVWVAWRILENQPLSKPWHEWKLGMEPHSKTSPYLVAFLDGQIAKLEAARSTAAHYQLSDIEDKIALYRKLQNGCTTDDPIRISASQRKKMEEAAEEDED